MTAYQLRIHLQRVHDVRIVGADYGTLITVHDIEHRAGRDHDHMVESGGVEVQS